MTTLALRTERHEPAVTFMLPANVSGIARLSETPLFLLALMELHCHGHQLPRSRFAAIEKIVEQLVEHQPQRRATDSLLTVSPQSNALPDRHTDGGLCIWPAVRRVGWCGDRCCDGGRPAVARASEVIVARQGTGNREDAEEQARSVFAFAESGPGSWSKSLRATSAFFTCDSGILGGASPRSTFTRGETSNSSKRTRASRGGGNRSSTFCTLFGVKRKSAT